MRYALLDHLACPVCLEPVLCIPHREAPSEMPIGRLSDGTRTSPGPGVGPMPAWRQSNDLTTRLGDVAGAPAAPERGRLVEVETGLLVCGPCGRWYPIENGIPEMLTDYLRDPNREMPLFEAVTAALPNSVSEALRRFRPSLDAASDPGAHYKRAEIGIKAKVDEPLFFVPGCSSPFAYWDSDFSIYLIKLFGAAAPLLNVKRGEMLVDSGCGYAWTTEWLFRSGFDPIGVDICRTYLDVGVTRMATPRPHLVVGDVENLPLATSSARAVLAYESFHHVPNRRRAIAGYHRVLQPGGTVVLAEPGAAHENAKASVDAMAKYGILEQGMELEDVRGYAEGTTFLPEQILTIRAGHGELGARLDATFVRERSVVEGNLFRLVKGGGAPVATPEPPRHEIARAGGAARLRRRVRSVLRTFLPGRPR
jgi:uncharacterized protein YbaR (Trm112 family)/SAM-dependent methyltransferase